MNFAYLACNPTDLADGAPTPDNIVCRPPFSTVGLKGGIACYMSTKVGAHAFYMCLKCGVESLDGSPFRTCLMNGNWSGDIPQCTCGKI